jgi:hypothetical protein
LSLEVDLPWGLSLSWRLSQRVLAVLDELVQELEHLLGRILRHSIPLAILTHKASPRPNQNLHSPKQAVLAGQHQRGSASKVRDIRIRARLQQQDQDLGVALDCGDHDCGLACVVAGVEVAASKEQLAEADISFPDGQHQRCVAVAVRAVEGQFAVLGEEGGYCLEVVAGDGLEETLEQVVHLYKNIMKYQDIQFQFA